MTHPVTQHSDSCCCCSRCDQVEPDASVLRARIAELEHLLAAERIAGNAGRGAFEAAVRAEARSGERLAKLEAALEWASRDDFVMLGPDCWSHYDHFEAFSDHKSSADALIALYERVGK